MEEEGKKINGLERDVDGSQSPPKALADRRFLLKFRIIGAVEEAAAPPPTLPADTKSTSHRCKLCGGLFNSGKALGGHMSSAHVQANKDYSYKKQNSSMKTDHRGSGPAATDTSCSTCGKIFFSKKSLYGHMRSHPERVRKAKIHSQETSSKPKQNSCGEIGSSSSTGNIGSNLKKWPTGKRGRKPINPNNRAPTPPSEEKEAIVAWQTMIRVLGETGKLDGPESDFELGSKRLTIQEREVVDDGVEIIKEMESSGKGKGNAVASEAQYSYTGSTASLPDDIDFIDESFLGAVTVLANGKKNQTRILEAKNSREKYCCNLCDKSFSSHQALGGHTSSHKKLKLNIVNGSDQTASTSTRQPKKKANGKLLPIEKVELFDLNMMPDQEEDKDGDAYT